MFKYKKWKNFDDVEKDKQQMVNIIGYYFGIMLIWSGIFSYIGWLATITRFNFKQQFGIAITFNLLFWIGFIVRHIFKQREKKLEKD